METRNSRHRSMTYCIIVCKLGISISSVFRIAFAETRRPMGGSSNPDLHRRVGDSRKLQVSDYCDRGFQSICSRSLNESSCARSLICSSIPFSREQGRKGLRTKLIVHFRAASYPLVLGNRICSYSGVFVRRKSKVYNIVSTLPMIVLNPQSAIGSTALSGSENSDQASPGSKIGEKLSVNVESLPVSSPSSNNLDTGTLCSLVRLLRLDNNSMLLQELVVDGEDPELRIRAHGRHKESGGEIEWERGTCDAVWYFSLADMFFCQ